MKVGIFDLPLNIETLRDYFSDKSIQIVYAEEPQAWIPPNLNRSGALLLTRMSYPAFGRVTSAFGLREHPITGKADFHTGTDIAAPLGSGVYAALPGTVVEAGTSDSYGNYLKLRHSSCLETVYCHCSELIAQEGDVLRAGEKIALVGATGIATGPHLHFEVLVNGEYTDPLVFFDL